MGYFPFYIDIKNKTCIIVGGGNVALRKIEKLLPFDPLITVISPDIISEILLLDVKILQRKFIDSDIDNAFMVISATDDEKLNSHIFEICQNKNILVNTVDDKDKCGFIFPALVCEKNIIIGISTAGKSPLYAKSLRKSIENLIDEKDIETIEILGKYREKIKNMFDTEEQRKNAFDKIKSLCINSDKIPNENDINSLLEKLI